MDEKEKAVEELTAASFYAKDRSGRQVIVVSLGTAKRIIRDMKVVDPGRVLEEAKSHQAP